MVLFLLISKHIFVSIHQIDQFAVFGLCDQIRVKINQLDSYSLNFTLFSMYLCFNFFQLLFSNCNVAIVHKNFLVASSWTWIIASERFQVLLVNFDTSFFLNLCGCYTHEISTLIYHSGRRFEERGLYRDSILFNQQQFFIDEHEYGHCMPSQEDIAGQFEPVFLCDGAHIDETHLIAEHLHSQNLDFVNDCTRLESVELFNVISKFLAGLDLCENGRFDVRKRKYGNDALLERQLECFDHKQIQLSLRKSQLIIRQQQYNTLLGLGALSLICVKCKDLLKFYCYQQAIKIFINYDKVRLPCTKSRNPLEHSLSLLKNNQFRKGPNLVRIALGRKVNDRQYSQAIIASGDARSVIIGSKEVQHHQDRQGYPLGIATITQKETKEEVECR